MFLDAVTATVTIEEIPPELVLNWDKIRIRIVHTWTSLHCATTFLDNGKARGTKVEMVGACDKWHNAGNFLPQLVHKGSHQSTIQGYYDTKEYRTISKEPLLQLTILNRASAFLHIGVSPKEKVTHDLNYSLPPEMSVDMK